MCYLEVSEASEEVLLSSIVFVASYITLSDENARCHVVDMCLRN